MVNNSENKICLNLVSISYNAGAIESRDPVSAAQK